MTDDGDDGESVFDKFMDDILVKELNNPRNARQVEVELPQRKYNRMYREIPHNRIKFTR